MLLFIILFWFLCSGITAGLAYAHTYESEFRQDNTIRALVLSVMSGPLGTFFSVFYCLSQSCEHGWLLPGSKL